MHLSETYYEEGGAKSPAAARRITEIVRRGRQVGHVLDVGCGNGVLLSLLADGALSLHGTDIHAAAVAQTRSRVPSADVRQLDIADGSPFADGQFDSILFCDVVEHVRNSVAALRELRRICAPDGVLLLTTPNANALGRLLLQSRWFALKDPSHVQFYTPFTLRHLLRKTGFASVQVGVEGLTGTPLDLPLRQLKVGGTIVAIARPC